MGKTIPKVGIILDVNNEVLVKTWMAKRCIADYTNTSLHAFVYFVHHPFKRPFLVGKNSYLLHRKSTLTFYLGEGLGLRVASNVFLRSNHRSSRPEVFFKNCDLRTLRTPYLKFLEFFSGTGAFLWILRNFSEHFFFRTPLMADSLIIDTKSPRLVQIRAFLKKMKKIILLKSIYFRFKTVTKRIFVFFGLSLGKSLIWQKSSSTWESDFKVCKSF